MSFPYKYWMSKRDIAQMSLQVILCVLAESTQLTYLYGHIPVAQVTGITGDWQRGLGVKKLKVQKV
jgi:hypothetical protein